MARYTGPSCRLCRREGQKLYLKGERCYSDKCAVSKRAYAPGQHGQRRTKLSNYGLQLREKQKVKRYYGLLEGQFRKYFDQAEKMEGITGENFLKVLETRLDNVVFRMGFASSRKEARQLVRHGHFLVNGKKVDIPSYLISVGDVIGVKEKSLSSAKFKALAEAARTVPAWVEANFEKLEGKIVALPNRSDVDLPIEEHLIVELYSK
ncbi:MAG: 30S ribosomal protein S4 [Anaeromicrobium sp.]|jgi:small subunit ribosomal protein S4|uniref:30S ribosomal protein S4 n=1 Tax=Anaeromicrobium sp. TaxID=1929132 RepID=UPI0025E57F55|nr:30S ribosomal protein S4 [Anaeromicrobium sp.]MCT4594519.1 30S ribosomal protein S4 [Anaeromicrobium sp.]